ncbi:GNAT family N-acetyltransferase [Streptomyces sp. H27-D2]|uniref:GNAT family N-acetyltransferase n=1 Tax=Streptomyces sp. H27-D2 TaxID=3046304 RepID=UPI002DB65B32|nr:GNAT family N-acetyltransferase [Streptomyces sp. H27-D2]MEC4015718.1 GNAT family N-acetyltransferase [Streptomyces sp. H27-D2]
MDYKIRTVAVEDWAELKTLRLAALSDPAARVAFVEDYDTCLEAPDSFWRGRATPAAEGSGSTGMIAADAAGTWVAMLAILDETDPTDLPERSFNVVESDGAVPRQTHIVGVYVRPEHRGTGVAELLLWAAVDWSWQHTDAERVRLWAHGENPRALAFYTRIGFEKTGVAMAFPPVPTETEYELALPRT